MTGIVRYQVMPPLSAEEYQELYEDIKANGVMVPIVVDENEVIIDGHHRAKIAAELGVPCPEEIITGKSEAEKRGMAFGLNLKRRHLSREQRRSLIAESLKADPQLSNREHARRTGASDPTVSTVRKELESRGEVQNFSTSIGSDGKSYPASQPKREVNATPVSEWPTGKPAPAAETPFTTASALPQSDLDELNNPEPIKTEPAKPRRTPITDDANRIGWEIRKAAEKLAALTEDDRYTTSKEKVTPLLRGHLQYVIEITTNALDDLTTPEE